MGLAVDNTLVYVTGGLALGQLKSSVGITCASCTNSSTGNYGALDTTKVGWVAGGGIEHKLGQHWSFKGEALYYDLGNRVGDGHRPHDRINIHHGFPSRGRHRPDGRQLPVLSVGRILRPTVRARSLVPGPQLIGLVLTGLSWVDHPALPRAFGRGGAADRFSMV